MNLEEINKNWIELGNMDPMWAILTDPAKKGNRWTADEFFETGRQDIKLLLKELASSGFSISFGKALDFGCGVGRLTQALAENFESVDGVDISSSMINHAQKFNRFPGKAFYHLNTVENLSLFPANKYDFIYSLICLQHMPRNIQENYISEFVRLLKPGGFMYFQTIHGHGWRAFVPDRAADLYRKLKHKGQPFIPLYGIPVDEVHKRINRAGATVEKYECEGFHDCKSRFKQDAYLVKKASATVSD